MQVSSMAAFHFDHLKFEINFILNLALFSYIFQEYILLNIPPKVINMCMDLEEVLAVHHTEIDHATFVIGEETFKF